MARVFHPRHNGLALLDMERPTASSRQFTQVLDYMRRSRIHHAITENPQITEAYVREFWRTAVRVPGNDNVASAIRATVAGREIEVNAAVIRRVLQLGDEHGQPVEFQRCFVVGCLRDRMGMRQREHGKYWKADIGGQWRHLMNVLLQCFSPRRDGSGSDLMSLRLMSILAGLALNKPINISQYVMDNMWDMFTQPASEQILLYPRFLQLIFNDLIPNLPAFAPFLEVKRLTVQSFPADLRLTRPRGPPSVALPLFGHIVDPNYQPPPHPRYYHVGTEPVGFAYDEEMQELIAHIAQPAEEENVEESEGEEEGDDDEEEGADDDEDSDDDDAGPDDVAGAAEVEGGAAVNVHSASTTSSKSKESSSSSSEETETDVDVHLGPVRDSPPPGAQRKRRRTESDDDITYEPSPATSPVQERRSKAAAEAPSSSVPKKRVNSTPNRRFTTKRFALRVSTPPVTSVVVTPSIVVCAGSVT